MPAENMRLMALAGAIADGDVTDWPDGGDAAGIRDDEVRELRVIAQVAAVHRRLSEASTIQAEAPPPPAPAPGATPDLSHATPWGPLLLLERIDGGMFGDVFRAWDVALDHEVALKRLRLPGSSPAASSVIREGQMLARVRHPNVVTVHGACQVDGEVGIWTEFVRGRTLERVVKEDGPMSAEEAAVVGGSLCRALAAVHRAGLLHRDIKASNVMREAGGRIVLLDFGAGAEAERLPAPGRMRLAGTPLYLAPELFLGAPVSVQSDIYSLGVLLYYLVTGTYPVTGRTLAGIQAAHEGGRRVLLSDARSDLPPHFIHVVERALSPEPERRFASAGAMLHELTGGVPSRAPAPRPSARWLVAGGLLAATVGIWVLGLISSLSFNVTLGRVGAFGTEPLVSYWIWGIRALVAPTVYMLAAAILVLLLRAALGPVGRLAELIGGPRVRMGKLWLCEQSSRLTGNPNAAGQALVAVQLASVVLVCLWFRPVLFAVPGGYTTSAPSILSPLRPDGTLIRASFILCLSLVALASTAGWIAVVRRSWSERSLLTVGTITAGVSVFALLIVLMVLPYRLLWHNRFDRVAFDGARCYVIGSRTADRPTRAGESGTDLLLYCPDVEPPRNRVVNAADPRVAHQNVIESIFTPPE
jgi:hypothetical protein